MVFLPYNALTSLDFPKILDCIARACYGDPGRNAVRNLMPMTDYQGITTSLGLVSEARSMLEQDKRIPLRHYSSVEDILHNLSVPAYVLASGELHALRDQFYLLHDIKAFATGNLKEEFPGLWDICMHLPDAAHWIKLVDELLDEEGNVKPDASERLAGIHQQLVKKKHQLDKAFEQELRAARKSGWLTELQESVRNGRRVLSLQAEHKRKVKGIIHDLSATGKTAYIEPESVLVLNNDIFELNAEMEEEIYRLLNALCEKLRPFVHEMQYGYEQLVLMDSILARAKYAIDTGAVLPEISPDPVFDIKDGKHPYLVEKMRTEGSSPVPFDLRLERPHKIVLVSGPNAGGKTVLMKAVGLLQMMIQSGILVPVSPDSKFGVFRKLLVEIGDQQSLEDDLSTYSSHLQHMRNFLKEADVTTLLLIDEFGAGTDPKIGGAIAEALLHSFAEKGVMGVITTHYGNLKAFAYKTDSVVNGAMFFDKENMLPTYRFFLGRPGSSFAFEIARRSNLDKNVLDYAQSKAGKHHRELEALLVELQEERDQLIEQNLELRKKEGKLERLIQSYDTLRADLDIKKKRWKLEKKESTMAEVNRLKRELSEAMKKVKAGQDLIAGERALADLEDVKTRVGEELGSLEEEVYMEDLKAMDVSALKPGDHVRLRKGNAIGTIERIDKGRALILVGALQMQVALKDLRPVKTPITQSKGKSTFDDVRRRKQSFNPVIDIRGLRPGEALTMLEQFFDDAVMADMHQVKVIHGKGKGQLRKLVHKKLKEYSVKTKYHLEPEQGGEGVTVIEFE